MYDSFRIRPRRRRMYFATTTTTITVQAPVYPPVGGDSVRVMDGMGWYTVLC